MEMLMTEAQVMEAYGMQCEGMAQGEIAKKFYVHKETLRNYFKRYGLPNVIKKRPVRNKTTGETFPSVSSAARKYDLQAVNIIKVCKGERMTTGGMVWEYIDE